LFTGALLAQVSIRSLPAQALLPVIIKYAVKPGIEPIRIAQLIDLLQPQGQGLLRQVIGERFVTTPHHTTPAPPGTDAAGRRRSVFGGCFPGTNVRPISCPDRCGGWPIYFLKLGKKVLE
jgi:hypothetical protein